MTSRLPTLVISGTIGAGKTALAEDVGDVLAEGGRAAAVIDLDWLGWAAFPEPRGAIDVEDLIIRNLVAVWPNFVAAGADCFVLARVVQTKEHRAALEKALPGGDLTFVLVTSDRDVIEERLRRRDSGAVLEEHLVQSVRFASKLEAAEVEDLRIANDGGRSIRSISLEILRRIGWI